MRMLYQYVFVWDMEEKDTFLEILTKHNKTLIANMEKGNHMEAMESTQSSEDSQEYFLLSSSSRSSYSRIDGNDCDLCGKNHDPADIPVKPNITGNTYRLELRCAGRFRCSETGIKFQVTRPVTIEYEMESWYNYINNPHFKISDVLGPLFKIKSTISPNVVSAVYLPHYVCLKNLSEVPSWIKCAHFKDGNLSVETPTQILPFHVVLENPSFSSFGVFCMNLLRTALAKYIPIHGKVLLYFRTAGRKYIEYKVHLYLMPAFALIDKEFLEGKTKNGFKKIDKPPRTRTIYTKKKYIVNGPEHAHVEPTELEVQCVSPLESYTDITMDAASVKAIDLRLVEENGQNKVWGCYMSRGEVEDLQSQVPKRAIPAVSALDSKAKFVDKHREQLIQWVSLVDPILDSLVAQELLNNEEYDTIRSKKTTQEQMRELFRIIRGWGMTQKIKVCEALEEHNPTLIQHLSEV
ncbi:NACHT, LRR and PYD domains-containing protein 1a allele 5-like isoform X2 [Pyxicephalus adspersus]